MVQKRHWSGKSNGGFSEGGFSNNRFVLKPDIAIASEVSILGKTSLTITDFYAKKTQHIQLFENPLPGTPPPPFAIPKLEICIFWCLNCSWLQVRETDHILGGVLRGNTIRGKRAWEGNLPLRGSLRGPLRGMVSELFRAFQRLLEVFQSFSEIFRGF